MEDTSKNRSTKHNRKQINVGLLAHVDAGKTTLSESMLYLSGKIRNMGRVDHGNAFLDNDDLERKRGITIFSKQAVFSFKDMNVTLLDTPGHVDFSADMERTLQVIDYAVLVISASDGVQGHTATLWKLLKKYSIPTFVFINKTDQAETNKTEILKKLRKELSDLCIDFDALNVAENVDKKAAEALAVCDERMLEEYLEHGTVCIDSIRQAISERKIFPCYSGAALKLTGVENFMEGLRLYTCRKEYPKEFGARVYKISRDEQDNRLTYLKVTGGKLKVKDTFPGTQEKVNQIRIYSGEKFEAVPEAAAGVICAVTGPLSTYPGQGVGKEHSLGAAYLEPILNYKIELPEGTDVHKMLTNLKLLEEEEPQLHIRREAATGEIYAQIMGEVQTEILRSIIFKRFGVAVQFGDGKIVYKETIKNTVEGVGHFEPLRHYAEVHLLLEPGKRGTGLRFMADISEDVLDRNWQRLILTHLEEKEHRGVLTGAALTDMKITLIAGRANKKHTEGGDFRQATYRAVRQGLMKAESVLLEPWYEFRLEMPAKDIGRALADIQKMDGKFEPPVQDGDNAAIVGSAPVSAMRGYQREFISYTGGRGRMFCGLKGFEECRAQEAVVKEIGYDPEGDLDNPAGSVFCAHGAGFVVPWYKAEKYMHVESPLKENKPDEKTVFAKPLSGGRIELTEKELDDIYKETLEHIQRNRQVSNIKVEAENKSEVNRKWEKKQQKKENRGNYLLVDGYNIIFAWEELKELAKLNIGAARERLMDILCNYQGYKKCTLILVFDAYKVEGNQGEGFKYHNIYVVYTKEAETADQYIEKSVTSMDRKYNVTVATSDALEQVIILGQGADRMSAADFYQEVKQAEQEIRREFIQKPKGEKNYLFDHIDKELGKKIEHIRIGKKTKN